MSGTFRKISRVGSLTGGTRWYLSDDCLLAAKRTLYSVEYRRFYLRDLECIVVWPKRLWLLRLLIPGVLLGLHGAVLWRWVNSIAGGIFVGMAIAWVAVELMLGPTGMARICTTGACVDLPLVRRTRRARKVLAKIDAAVRASRDVAMQPAVPVPSLQPAASSARTSSEAAPAITSVADVSQTNGI